MTDISRRNALGSIALGAAAAAVPLEAGAQTASSFCHSARLFRRPCPRPLGFDATRLTGLSEKLIRSHWENNYQGSVKALNMVEGRLAAAMADKDLPPVIYGDLKREELHRTGSVILHELYFEQFGDGVAKGAIRDALAKSHGSFEAWEAEFRRTAMALAGDRAGAFWRGTSTPNLCTITGHGITPTGR
jgi:Fe-Mn family superoxide dismutase